jgi:DNA-binding IclR family transcriptional regulator
MTEDDDRSGLVSALERGFSVLECFAAAGGPLGNKDVAQRTAIPRPTVSRLIATLVALGQLRPVAGGEKYELASGVVRLAQAFLGAIDVRQYARPHVAALSDATGVSVFLGVRDGDDMLVIEGARSRSAALLMGADIGTRMALATSALGRAWLAGVDAATRDAIVTRWRAKAPNSAPFGAALDKALADARRLGYAASLGEWHPNINAVAVPISTASGEVISLNCGSPAFVIPSDKLIKNVVPQLRRAAQAIAHDIGGLSGSDLIKRQPKTRIQETA